jgi:hypothetical protein
MHLLRQYIRESTLQTFSVKYKQYKQIVKWTNNLKTRVLAFRRRLQHSFDPRGDKESFRNYDRNIQESITFLENNIEMFAEDPDFETTLSHLETAHKLLWMKRPPMK